MFVWVLMPKYPVKEELVNELPRISFTGFHLAGNFLACNLDRRVTSQHHVRNCLLSMRSPLTDRLTEIWKARRVSMRTAKTFTGPR